MKRIYQLSPLVANQIAAGEVIERPASVLKELLENSLDAGSYEINVRIEGGGTRLIEVQDNGCGICKEDLSLALSQHATSKIQTVSDLESILSYGFRGEALASIASVSRLSLSAAVEGETSGWQLKISARGQKPALSVVPMRRGTRIEVRDLFYNTPVRRKFLKSAKTEKLHLEEVFKRIALSQFEVAFSLSEGENFRKKYPPCRTEEAKMRRVRAFCGKNFVSNASYMEAEANGLKITGWVGQGGASRAQADLQYFYVNGRIVRDKVVNHALREAYQSFCPIGRYPAYLLFLELDPASVDVNVHPTKHEVRFREPRSLHAFLVYSLSQALNQKKSLNKTSSFENKKTLSQDFFQLPFTNLGFKNPADKEDKQAQEKNFPAKIKPIAMLGKEYLIAENDAGWLFVDLKAARRLIAVQQLQREYNDNHVRSRPLLLPQSLKLGKTLLEKIETRLLKKEVDWQKCGFEFTLSQVDTILVRSLPAILKAQLLNFDEMIIQIFQCRAEQEVIEKLAEIVTTFPFTLEESDYLLSKLMVIKNEGSLPGKKVYKQLNLEEIGRVFL